MKKETWAAAKSGAVAGIPVAVFLYADMLPVLWKVRSSLIATHPMDTQGIFFATILTAVLSAAVSLGMMALLGAIGGLVFVVSLNKLPIRSTYVKSAIPFVALWALGFLNLLWSSSDSFIQFAIQRSLFFLAQ